jgi:ABC-type phosphate/phosphonate transport system substrate-binding protein
MRRILAGLAATLFLGAAAPASPTLRIAVAPAAPGPCAPPAGAAAGEKAYYDHLAHRLDREVLRCPFADTAAAAAALAQGKVDMARLDPAAYAPVSAQVRAILTVRGKRESNRIPVYVAVRDADPAHDVAALKGRGVAFGGRSAAGLTTPQAVLADRGLQPTDYRPQVEPDGDEALVDLRAGRVEAAAVNGAAWQRVCRMSSPKEPTPCRDLRVLVRARPKAAWALAVRRDMPSELRYRLIGIHVALHLENPAAFAFAAAGAPDPAEFQPAEAEALTVAALK